MTVQNIEQLRDVALRTLERLEAGEIDVQDAIGTAKICDTVINTIKSQFEYGKLLNQVPDIAFMSRSHNAAKFDDDGVPVLEYKKSRALTGPSD